MFLYISAYNLYKNFTWLIIPEIVLFSINCKRASLPQLSHSIRQVAFSSFVSWMARPRPNRETAWCTATWHRVTLISHLTPIRLTHVPGYFIGVPTRLESSSTPRATLLSFALPSSSSLHLALEFSKRKRETERERRQSFLRWKLSENKSGVYRSMYNLIDLYIYIDTLELWVDIIVIIVVDRKSNFY